MNKKLLLRGSTLIELMTSLLIASAFSVGLYSVFVEGSKGIQREHVLMDVKNYATNVLDIITSNIQKADEVDIQTYLGSNLITIKPSDQEQEVRYSVINNLIYENENPIKLPGYDWLRNNQNLYDVRIDMICEQGAASFSETSDPDIQSCLYDITLTIDIESKIDEDYSETINAYNRVFAVNKFSLL